MIIYNAIRTPDGTVIESKHRWDYQAHTDANGQVYAVADINAITQEEFDIITEQTNDTDDFVLVKTVKIN